ncbi:4-diphosphocytidyl-2-C-methyl-D-erythritol kinase [Chromohalobacter marismortui]|uniref:4-diphosphocytidyl-2-C-methyl-D-erythritol kinase n=1 Tax=Chromohalobacter marismortui TaxID=42055 RepID=A0A4V3F4U6_9GAMM|nr:MULTISPECIES: 4-(cytidine 5'-diphospho)-2-C-methyl-D-erythritol kinase [Chromohalobacter]MCI0510448.1 4-(cytidine 5'-diphospho)-2-C-methyl-D-erythritol kinase [Chromohalobacter sp.]MCI0594199.1 4-(cytidine 5'-diphospho)-2-C-methyl-D-erythritol kinase [Chromohalobacter sp.]TDU24976.1 4-diphosphocytidyl-2-C-methyl-D-erythritol kinase [Chromohalobacter marismortui]
MNARLSLPAPAKLNRMLHIVGRRADGYHELQTLFQFLDHGDTLAFAPREDGIIRLHPAMKGIDHDANLIVRAARLLQHESGTTQGADIHLDKRLPLGGGLGGGSSDAATTLLALDRLWSLSAGLPRLAELGLSLGADVPVFIYGHSAWAEGIGERLTPVTLATPWFVVIHPGEEISTPAVFGHPELTRNTPPISMARALRGEAEQGRLWRNDCEAAVKRLSLKVAHALDWLSAFGPAMLTGTGSCVFCPLMSEQQADRILRRVDSHWHAFKARGCNISPLHDALDIHDEMSVKS